MATTHQNETAATQSELAVVEKAQPVSQPQFESISFSNISRWVTGGDVVDEIQDQVDAPRSYMWPEISPIHHHCLVHGVVGHAISKFECTKQLVRAVFDALQAHSHAFEVAKLLHRDISAGNITITDKGKGLLIDWELAKNVGEGGSDRTGTWQFMSAKMLMHSGKMHTLTDDPESFLHLIGWMTLRYVPATDSYESDDRGRDMAMFDERTVPNGQWSHGGFKKSSALCGNWYPSDTFQPRNPTPIFKLVQQLRKPFKSLYEVYPTEKDRMKTNFPLDPSDRELLRLRAVIDQHDEDIRLLQSSSFFIDEMQKALDKNDWPTGDKADTDLPITLPVRPTVKRSQTNASWFRHIHSVWERSVGLPRRSKRAASPAPESGTKRRRGTPAGLESQA